MKRTLVSILALLVTSSIALAAAHPSTPAHGSTLLAAEHPMMPSGDEVTWGNAPPVLPAGAQLAVLDGDPAGNGPYTVRLKLPDGYQIKPHTHPAPEHVTVLSGTFNVGMGPNFDTSNGKAMAAGGFGTMPGRMPHYAWTSGETIIQIHGMGPFAMTYVNPADDPSRK